MSKANKLMRTECTIAKDKVIQLPLFINNLSAKSMDHNTMLLKLSAHNKSSQSNYENKTLGLSVGIQDSNNHMTRAISHDSNKFVTIVEGSAEIKNSITGKITSVNQGESFVLPQDYTYQWQQSANLIAFHLTYQASRQSLSIPENHKDIFFIDEGNDTPWQNTSDGYKKKVEYQSQNKNFTAGVWQGGQFKTEVIAFPYNEFIIVKFGTLICTDEQGNTHTINTNEALFVPQGTHCSWASQGKISLHFVQVKKS